MSRTSANWQFGSFCNVSVELEEKKLIQNILSLYYFLQQQKSTVFSILLFCVLAGTIYDIYKLSSQSSNDSSNLVINGNQNGHGETNGSSDKLKLIEKKKEGLLFKIKFKGKR